MGAYSFRATALHQPLSTVSERDERAEHPGPLNEDEFYARMEARGYSQEDIDEQRENDEHSHWREVDQYQSTILQQGFKESLRNTLPDFDSLGWHDTRSFVAELMLQVSDMDLDEDSEECLRSNSGSIARLSRRTPTDHLDYTSSSAGMFMHCSEFSHVTLGSSLLMHALESTSRYFFII